MSEAYKLARTDDPETSHLAAEWVEPQLGDLQKASLEMVEANPGSTARELEEIVGAVRSTIGRRLGELETKGLVERGAPRKCTITGRMAATWVIPSEEEHEKPKNLTTPRLPPTGAEDSPAPDAPAPRLQGGGPPSARQYRQKDLWELDSKRS